MSDEMFDGSIPRLERLEDPAPRPKIEIHRKESKRGKKKRETLGSSTSVKAKSVITAVRVVTTVVFLAMSALIVWGVMTLVKVYTG